MLKPLIYLASASPRRSALLTQIGVAHRVRPVDVDERVQPGERPEDYVRRLALLKAQTLWTQLDAALDIDDRRPVLGSDTTVALDGEILGKPRDEQDCRRMLQLLSARTHQVHTAVALCRAADAESKLNGSNPISESLVSSSEVTFRALAPEDIAAYWRSGEPVDKAGGYAVQGLAAVFIERIAGSYSGIMGLPLYETAQLLTAIGWRLNGITPAATQAVTGGAITVEVHG